MSNTPQDDNQVPIDRRKFIRVGSLGAAALAAGCAKARPRLYPQAALLQYKPGSRLLLRCRRPKGKRHQRGPVRLGPRARPAQGFSGITIPFQYLNRR